MKTTERQNMLPFLLILLVAISFGAAGQIMLKSGLSQLSKDAPVITVLLSVFQNLRVFTGFFFYFLSSLIYLIALKKLPLSYAYPMVALSYVLVVGLSWKIFGETIPPLRLVALGIILTGVILLACSEDVRKDMSDSGKAVSGAVETTTLPPVSPN